MLCIPKLFYLVVGITFVICQSETIINLLFCSFGGKKVFLLKPVKNEDFFRDKHEPRRWKRQKPGNSHGEGKKIHPNMQVGNV